MEPDYEVMKKAAGSFRAINHKTRKNILQLLDQKGELSVTDIYTWLRLEQSRASAYLGMMRQANLVQIRPQGKQHFYSVNYEQIRMMEELSKRLTK